MATLPPRRTPNAGRAIDTGVRPVDLNTAVDTSVVDRAVQNFGQTIASVGDNMQKEQDASAIFAARRQLDDWERTAIYDPEKGAIGKKGADAFSLPKVIPEEFDKAASKIGQGLQGERQRRAFEELATSRRAQVGDWAARHSTQQRQVYNEGQYNADIDSGLNRAAMLASTGDFNTAKAEVGLMQTRTTGYMRSLGKSEEEIGVAVRNVASKANVTAINMLLDGNKPMAADKYLKDNAASMNVEDLLRAQSAVGKSVAAHEGLVTATEIVQSAVKPAIAPNDSDRAFNILIGTESNGQQFSKDGKPLTSSAGAIGIAQVMPKTGPEAAKLAGLPWDEAKYKTDPAYNRAIGKAYFGKQVQEFGGNLAQAYAAYNAGPAAVKDYRDGTNTSGKNPNKIKTPDGIPPFAETQAYVKKNMSEYEAGGGVPKMPTLQDLHAQVRERIGMDNPQRYKTAIEEVNRQYKDMIDAKKQGEETNLAEAMKEVAANGGRVSKLSPGRLASLAPKDLDSLYSYGQKVAKGDDITNPVLFQKMATDDAYLKGMTDEQFFIQTRQLSEGDGEKMAMRRGQLLNKNAAAGQKATDLDTTSINSVLNNRLVQIGIDPTPKDATADAQRVGAIRQTVWGAVQRAQVTAGKKLSDTEVAKVVDELFVQQATVPDGFFSKRSKQVNLMRMKPSDIPGDVRDALEKDFKAAGITNPTPGDFLGAYLQLQTTGK